MRRNAYYNMHTMICSLKSIRKSFGYSQVQLAHLSQVSLPTIQNVEAQKANLTIETLEKLLLPLGNLQVKISPPPFRYSLAIKLGAPLTSKGSEDFPGKPTPELLVSEAKSWVVLFSLRLLSEREKQSLTALLMAIRSHYPSFYNESLNFPIFESMMKTNFKNGKVVKLKRLALHKVSSYL